MINSKRMLYVISLSVLFITSCSSKDDTTQPLEEFDKSDYQATVTKVKDIGEEGNGADIQVAFSGGTASDKISEYRVFVSKADISKNDIDNDAINLTTTSYLKVENASNVYTVRLGETQTDFEGNPIVNDVSYVAWVLTIGAFTEDNIAVVSEASNAFSLKHENLVTTLVPAINSNDALSVDADGNIYASNFGVWSPNGGNGAKILKITPDGTVSDYITGLHGPLDHTIDSNGDMYFVDGNNGSTGNVMKFTKDGTKTLIKEISGWPAGIILDKSGNIYVSNYSEPRVDKLLQDGTLSTFAEDTRLKGCVGIAIDEDENILVGNYNDGNIYSINSDGQVSSIAKISGIVSDFGLGYITYYSGFIYATGIGNHKIYKVSHDGEVSVFAGNGTKATKDGPLLEASFQNPNGIAIDEVNKIMYIQDWGKTAIRKIVLPE